MRANHRQPGLSSASPLEASEALAPPELLISLGTSPAIVPEAFFLPGTAFAAVHVLTTARPELKMVQDFFADQLPPVRLTITRVDGFEDFHSERDHFHFEEVLFRWVLASCREPHRRYFCLSGGFKTMSAAMQKAAAVLGAAEVFHVLADKCCIDDAPSARREPRTADEVRHALDGRHLHFIRLGRESGWPQLHAADPSLYPLRVARQESFVHWVSAPDFSFSDRLRDIVERSHHIADAWERLPNLPFPELATWSAVDLAWLREPVEIAAPADRTWVKHLPKIELHCHLGGFATHGQPLEIVRDAACDPSRLPKLKDLPPPPGWPFPSSPIELKPYCDLGGNNGTELLRDPGCLKKQCELLYRNFVDQRILYAEVRCSPANYSTDQRSPWDVLVDIRNFFADCMQKDSNHEGGPCLVNLILIATRRDQGDYRSEISRHLSLAVTAAEHWRDPNTCRVVGVDLAGFENPTTRAHYFREEFTAVHRCGLALTVHAGENDDAEGIWRAVFDLNARRIGHALTLRQSPRLLGSVADRGIAVEMCPYANLQIRGFPLDEAAKAAPPEKRYPLLDYLGRGVAVTINTDNIGISGANLTENLLLSARLCPGLTRLDLVRMQRLAINSAFLPVSKREQLARVYAEAIPQPSK